MKTGITAEYSFSMIGILSFLERRAKTRFVSESGPARRHFAPRDKADSNTEEGVALHLELPFHMQWLCFSFSELTMTPSGMGRVCTQKHKNTTMQKAQMRVTSALAAVK